MGEAGEVSEVTMACLVLCVALPDEDHPAALERRLRRRLDRHTLDRLRSMLGRLLLRHGLRLRGLDDGAGVMIGHYGKPRLLDGLAEFNLSHAGRWVMCALAPTAVGIDVEQMRPFDLVLARRLPCNRWPRNTTISFACGPPGKRT